MIILVRCKVRMKYGVTITRCFDQILVLHEVDSADMKTTPTS